MSSPSDLTRAVAVLERGGLVAFPTETVYGLGADATDADAVRRLFAVKGRPPGHPVIAHLADADALDAWVEPDDVAQRLAQAWWPGPLTLVLRRRAGGIVDEVTGGRPTVGVRVPDHPLALDLLHDLGRPVAAPSANRFGRVSPTTAADVRADLGGDVDVVLDGGPCRVGVESTIVDCTGSHPVVLRVGGVPRGDVERTVGRPVPLAVDAAGRAPGTLPSHYAPHAQVRVLRDVDVPGAAHRVLAAGLRVGVLAEQPPEGLPRDAEVLPAPGGTDEYARVLYARLRDADRRGLDVLLAVPPVEHGVGEAVADRLRRAAGGSG